MSAFAKQMVVQRRADGQYVVDLDPRWNCPVSTHGGTAAAVVASAMASELGDESQALRTISVMYAAPVGPGPADIDVRIARRGRTVCRM